MNGVFSTLLGPILVLWIGALVLDIVDRLLEPQDQGVAEASVLLLSVGFLLAAHGQSDAPLPLAPALAEAGWPGPAPYLLGDPARWLLALLLLGSALAASLASLGSLPAGRSGRLAALGGALLFCFAGDWATVAAAWVLVDAALLYSTAHEGKRATLKWTGALSLVGALALGTAVALWPEGSASTFSFAAPLAAALAVIATLLRLMPLPLPSWQAVRAAAQNPTESVIERVILFAAPTALAAQLWMRLSDWPEIAANSLWPTLLLVWGIGVLFASAVQAWTASDPDELAASAGTYGRALILLAAGVSTGQDSILALSSGLILVVPAWFVSWPQCTRFQVFILRSYWRLAPSALALASLAGLLLTAGFAGHAGLYKTIFDDQRWLVLLLTMLGQALFLGASLRILFDMEPDNSGAPPSASDEVAFGASLALGAGIVIAGLAPSIVGVAGLGYWLHLPTIPVWAAIFLPAVGAVALYRRQDVLLGWTEAWRPLIRRLLQTHWLFQQGESLLSQLGSLIWDVTQVVEGAGYMAWVVLVWLVLLMFILVR